MSRPRYWWWRSVKDTIRQYPEMRQAIQDQIPSAATAHCGPQTPNSYAGRTVEGTAIKRLCDRDAQDYEAIEAAIRETAKMPNGEIRLTIIDLLYWKHYNTQAGAGMQVGYCEDRVKEINGEFIRLVAFYMGRIPREAVRLKKKKSTVLSQKTGVG